MSSVQGFGEALSDYRLLRFAGDPELRPSKTETCIDSTSPTTAVRACERAAPHDTNSDSGQKVLSISLVHDESNGEL